MLLLLFDTDSDTNIDQALILVDDESQIPAALQEAQDMLDGDAYLVEQAEVIPVTLGCDLCTLRAYIG